LNLSLSQLALFNYVDIQLKHFFPDKNEHASLSIVVENALQKTNYCFQHIALNHYYKNGSHYFNHLNADQYTIFIYYASNIAYEIYHDEILANKLFYLNKVLNQFHCMYNTKLPDIFLIVHGSGTILGKATYSNYFVVSQHCNIGANPELEYPVISDFVIMYPNSSIIGKSLLGNNCCIANGAFINNEIIEPDKLIIGRSPNLILKENSRNRFDYFFKN